MPAGAYCPRIVSDLEQVEQLPVGVVGAGRARQTDRADSVGGVADLLDSPCAARELGIEYIPDRARVAGRGRRAAVVHDIDLAAARGNPWHYRGLDGRHGDR